MFNHQNWLLEKLRKKQGAIIAQIVRVINFNTTNMLKLQ